MTVFGLSRGGDETNIREDAVKIMVAFMGTLAGLAPVTAGAADAGKVDKSGVVVWIFLGLCALIVAAQVIPPLLRRLGLSRGKGKPGRDGKP
ncbi:hypothetical protein Ppro_3075 [Pelobacter propionicus DSM 2379]|uniref:Uncharacterized protein n=2 Tax=Pelobacter propionicus TaxID=29543 RepID=A1ATK0_PELPD|nr:hypothetical protein Ppro_3075 [Pelobacter propionicus DSM 2379]